jgi:RNA polymerase sigma-70 factor (ECF subfamily)
MKYNDIADVLDMPLNTVKSHIRRGKERLASLLQNPDPQPAQPQLPAPEQRVPPSAPAGPFARLAAPMRFALGGV